MREITMGSLFSGSASFELAGVLCGIKPIWNSEIEPFCLRVEKERFPNVKQLGSVTGINGAEIDPVDIVTFGSPCQDLSVAGARKGIHDGERSNLFFEAIRIIKEMRDKDRADGRTDKLIRPRFAVFENVPGAFSSNKGADFQAVLQAFCDIMEDGLHIPRPKKWNHAGCVAGNGWSLAWRVYDAQYWPGTPQRRKRIYLVADFASERAGEILFECKGLRGHSQEGQEARKELTAHFEGSVGGSGGSWRFKERAGKPGGGKEFLPGHERAFTLSTNVDQSVCYALDSLSSNSMKSANPHSVFHEEQVAKTLQTNHDPTCNQGGNVIVTIEGNGSRESHHGPGFAESDTMYTLNTVEVNAVAYRSGGFGVFEEGVGTLRASGGDIVGGTESVIVESTRYMEAYKHHGYRESDIAGTLTAGQNQTVRGDTPMVLIDSHRDHDYAIQDVCPTMQHRMGTGGGNVPIVLMEVPDE